VIFSDRTDGNCHKLCCRRRFPANSPDADGDATDEAQGHRQQGLLRARLEQIVDLNHPLVKLAGIVNLI
jgi:hypothetical protein